MAKKNNRVCIICGKSYHFCPTCGSDASKPAWYHIFDGERCEEIYDICVSYRDKVISTKEAYDRLSKLDLSDLENFASVTKAQIEEIMKYGEPKSEPTVKGVKIVKANNSKRNNKNNVSDLI